jgi:hypothetical protein
MIIPSQSKGHRNKGMNVFFINESRVNKGSAVEKAWKDTTLKLPHHFLFWKAFP